MAWWLLVIFFAHHDNSWWTVGQYWLCSRTVVGRKRFTLLCVLPKPRPVPRCTNKNGQQKCLWRELLKFFIDLSWHNRLMDASRRRSTQFSRDYHVRSREMRSRSREISTASSFIFELAETSHGFYSKNPSSNPITNITRDGNALLTKSKAEWNLSAVPLCGILLTGLHRALSLIPQIVTNDRKVSEGPMWYWRKYYICQSHTDLDDIIFCNLLSCYLKMFGKWWSLSDHYIWVSLLFWNDKQ